MTGIGAAHIDKRSLRTNNSCDWWVHTARICWKLFEAMPQTQLQKGHRLQEFLRISRPSQQEPNHRSGICQVNWHHPVLQYIYHQPLQGIEMQMTSLTRSGRRRRKWMLWVALNVGLVGRSLKGGSPLRGGLLIDMAGVVLRPRSTSNQPVSVLDPFSHATLTRRCSWYGGLVDF